MAAKNCSKCGRFTSQEIREGGQWFDICGSCLEKLSKVQVPTKTPWWIKLAAFLGLSYERNSK